MGGRDRVTHVSEDTVTDGAVYNAARYAQAFPPGYEDHFWHQARRRVVLAELAKQRVSAVLDIGCGPGQYVQAIRAAGYDGFGCEPGEAIVEATLAPYVLSRTDVEALPMEMRARVNVALLLDVIEHLPDPAAFLLRVKRALPRLETLIVTVPARAELWSELDRRAGHHQRFVLEDLIRLLHDVGFHVVDATYLFRMLYPVAWLTARRAHSRVVASPRHPRLHRALGRVLAAERRLLPRTLPGTSALCVARLS